MSEQPDVVCIVETWLDENILDSEISIANYSVVRSDRNRHGGGIVMYIRDCLHCDVYNVDTQGLELAIVTVTSNSFRICIGLWYRPPCSPVFVLDSLFSVLESLDPSYFSNFVLIGDFNIDYNNSLHPLRQRLDTIISSFSLVQVVADPTHTDSNGRSSLIDLALLSSPEKLSSCSVIPPLENSTYNVHSGIHLKMRTRTVRNKRLSRRTVWRYKHANFEKANRLIESLDMTSILDPNDIDYSWENWRVEFLRIMDECVPKATLPNRSNIPWLTKDLVHSIQKRNYHHRMARKTGRLVHEAKYKKIRNKVVSKLKKKKSEFFNNLKPNSKEFWRAVKVVQKQKSSIPTLSGNITDDKEKANVLNTHFSKCFNSTVPPLCADDIPYCNPDECPEELLCCEEEVLALLHNLEVKKASGMDGISAHMLKATAHSITPGITQLFNISIKLGRIPDLWKDARVTPIPKGGDPTDLKNYRPISLLSILSKLLERHMYAVITSHLNSSCPLSDCQWGFTPGRSTTGALVNAIESWHQILESGSNICAVFFDLKKAFDSVPHRPLLQKLASLNLDFHIYTWISHYLCKRTQCVGVGGVTSDTCSVTSGVPQGSVLGPLLFLIYIDDISRISISSGSLTLYADDLVLYRPVRGPSDYRLLQEDIDAISLWTSTNYLSLNPSKCKYMIISRKRQPPIPVTNLKVNCSDIERVSTFRYLGVWISSDLSWSTQVTSICKNTRRLIGLLYRRFYRYSSQDTLKQLYTSYIRPHLEYAVPAWDPHLQSHINALESLQKFALKVCTKKWNASYENLLELSGLPTLASRRTNLKLCFLYRVLHNPSLYTTAPLLHRNIPVNVRNASLHSLVRPFAHTNSYFYSFFPHSISLWNDLPSVCQIASNLTSFKYHLTRLL